jgi:hypothetical protein
MSSDEDEDTAPSEQNMGDLANSQDNSIYYEVDVSCPKLTLSGDSEYLDPNTLCEGEDLNCTFDLKSSTSSASVGTQSNLSMLSPTKDSETQTGKKRPQLEMSPGLEHKYKRMRFSRERVKARPPLRNKKKSRSTCDYILSVTPDESEKPTLMATGHIKLHDHTCSLQ